MLCLNCGKETQNIKFCSRRCSGLFSGKFIKKTYSKRKIFFCKNCSKETYNKYFCSKTCSITFSNHSRKKIRYCKICSNERKKGAGIYCSRECELKDKKNKI